MYSYDRRAKSAGSYQTPMVKLVKEVDACAEAEKAAKKGLLALGMVEKLVKDDVGGQVSGLPDLDPYAPQQHIDSLRKALQTLQSAARDVGSIYDGMNAAFLRMGLK